MIFRQFEQACRSAWNGYLQMLAAKFDSGAWVPPAGYDIAYPTTMLLTQSPQHLIVELTGISRRRVQLTIKKGRAKSANSYFGTDAPGPALFTMQEDDGQDPGFIRSMSLATDEAWRKATQINPHLGALHASRVLMGGEISRAFDLTDANHLNLGCVLILQSVGSRVCVRFVHEAVCIKESNSLDSFEKYLQRLLTSAPIRGIHMLPGLAKDRATTASTLFSNIYNSPVGETTIGHYLDKNADVLKGALGAVDHRSEVRLRWRDGDSQPGTLSIPDLMLRRIDGFWDICDLKLPLHSKRSLTHRSKRRRGFIDGVDDGLGQLADYDAYFQTPENAEYARSKFGISVNNPRKLLIVGNGYNYNAEAVAQALRKYDSTYSVLSYDSLLILYLASQGYDMPAVSKTLVPLQF